MCLACEQDSIWLAYLESRGLLKADDPDAVDALFAAFPVQPLPIQGGDGEQQTDAASTNSGVADQNSTSPFSCDDPTASAADLRLQQSSRKPE
jgi:hypothetical protein